MDYKPLTTTRKNCYSISHITNLIDTLSKALIFTKINLQWKYNNVCIYEGNEWKTAFIIKCGLFKAIVMHFSFANTPATFQTIMNNIFTNLICKNKVIIYFNDIFIFENNMKKHQELVKSLTTIGKNNLFAKAKKCFFKKSLINYLEIVISKNWVTMNFKVSEIMKWLVLQKVKQIQAF